MKTKKNWTLIFSFASLICLNGMTNASAETDPKKKVVSNDRLVYQINLEIPKPVSLLFGPEEQRRNLITEFETEIVEALKMAIGRRKHGPLFWQ